MEPRNAFYAQSGGVTAVINATACGVIQTARKHSNRIPKVFAGRYGIQGALREELVDTSLESEAVIEGLKFTPGGAFGSCRYQLKPFERDPSEYKRLINVFRSHNIGYFFYNGGGDSQDTSHKLAKASQELGYPLICVGIPKTIDNDLLYTDTCPGFGSVAKYVAISTREAALDLISATTTSTQVFILEVMGRHAGWIAAAGGLATQKTGDAPHLILFPEIAFDETHFYEQVAQTIKQHNHCVIIASEGVKASDGCFLAESGDKDAFGHARLGGVAPKLAAMVKAKLGYKCHWAVSDYLQRSARHIASKTDFEQAYALGSAAVEAALQGKSGVMMTIERQSDTPYRWTIGEVALSQVANGERFLPRNFITSDGFHIAEACRAYLMPLIQGEAYPPYKEGLPHYICLKNKCVEKQLPPL